MSGSSPILRTLAMPADTNPMCCYGRVLRIGNTSIAIALEVWIKKVLPEIEEAWPSFKVTEAEERTFA